MDGRISNLRPVACEATEAATDMEAAGSDELQHRRHPGPTNPKRRGSSRSARAAWRQSYWRCGTASR
jgi:hypothetical protein